MENHRVLRTPDEVREFTLQLEVELSRLMELARRIFPTVEVRPVRVFYTTLESVPAVSSAEARTIMLGVRHCIEDPEMVLTDSLPHELAHVVAADVFGPDIEIHGPEWALVARALGVLRLPGEHTVAGDWASGPAAQWQVPPELVQAFRPTV